VCALPQFRNKNACTHAVLSSKYNTNENHSHSFYENSKEAGPMIVCVCNNISDREIRQAVDLGISSMAELHRELGVGTCCGKCVSYAREVLNTHLDGAIAARVTELRRTSAESA
jgi:bacterioferritin-associated ferredoxin